METVRFEHIGVWTDRLEDLKEFYTRFFNGTAGNMYHNEKKGFKSYFITFSSGARLEIMSRADIPPNLNDTRVKQHLGIIHMAFEVDSREEVDSKAREFAENGFEILDGPRLTGDGYYEFATLDPDGNRLEVTTAG